MSSALTAHTAVEIRIGDVGLVPKLDAIAAALAAVKDAHRDAMNAGTWAAIGDAEDALGRATICAITPGNRLNP